MAPHALESYWPVEAYVTLVVSFFLTNGSIWVELEKFVSK